jgi:transposase
MARPYSLDLRERAVARVAAGESVRSVAVVLQISVASVVKWSQRFRRTGSAAAGPMHGHRPRLLLPHRDWLLSRMADGKDFTLRGLQAELAERGVKVDLELRPRRGAELQKKAFCQASKNGLTSRAFGRGGRSIKDGSTPGALSSSTRPGRKPTWHRSGAGLCAGGGFLRAPRTGTGKP